MSELYFNQSWGAQIVCLRVLFDLSMEEGYVRLSSDRIQGQSILTRPLLCLQRHPPGPRRRNREEDAFETMAVSVDLARNRACHRALLASRPLIVPSAPD
jgi:hypothetical protein